MKRKHLLVANTLVVLFLLLSSSADAKRPPKPPPPQNATPVVESVASASATVPVGVLTGFTAVYSDADGWGDIASGQLIVDTSTDRRQCCYVHYDQNANLLYLRSDNNKQWLGGYAPGSAHRVENSQVLLDCAASSASGSGTRLSITWALAFKSAFLGLKNIYLYVEDDKGAIQGWVSMGTCDIVTAPQDTTPPTGAVSINEGAPYTNSLSVSLLLAAQDEAGGSGIALMRFSDDGTAWSDPVPYAASRSWTLPAGEGTKTVYVRFADAAGNWSLAYSDMIILDMLPPELSVTYPQEGEVIGN